MLQQSIRLLLCLSLLSSQDTCQSLFVPLLGLPHHSSCPKQSTQMYLDPSRLSCPRHLLIVHERSVVSTASSLSMLQQSIWLPLCLPRPSLMWTTANGTLQSTVSLAASSMPRAPHPKCFAACHGSLSPMACTIVNAQSKYSASYVHFT